MEMKPHYVTLVACMALMSALGTIHAFSVFLAPWEEMFQASRAEVSLVYSLALVFLTLSVLSGHRIYGLLHPALLIIALSAIATLGVLIAAHASSLPQVWLGYSLLFGGANGVGYGFSLQLSAQAMPRRKGFAMGVVTASYAVGFMVFPVISEPAFNDGGIGEALELLSGLVAGAGVVAAFMIYLSGSTYQGVDALQRQSSPIPTQGMLQLKLWTAYGTGVAAGLMAIGHAVGIVEANGGSATQTLGAPVLIALGNMAGGVSAGFMLDRVRARRLLVALAGISAITLIGLSESGSPMTALAGLVMTGFCYGAIISAYPVTVAVYFGLVQSSSVYGRVFTAWGLAGLTAPWLAGTLYDHTGGYAMALKIAGVAALASAIAAYNLPKVEPEKEIPRVE